MPPSSSTRAGRTSASPISELRQDPQSHHLVLLATEARRRSRPSATSPAAAASATASPARRPTSVVRRRLLREPGHRRDPLRRLRPARRARSRCPIFGRAASAGAPGAQATGVYAEIPVRGLWVWNSHAFNLTTPRPLDERAHQLLVRDRPGAIAVQRIFGISKIFAQSTPPYGSETLCTDQTFPRHPALQPASRTPTSAASASGSRPRTGA